MAVANSSYEFEITSTEARDGAHPKSGLLTAVVQGTCTDKEPLQGELERLQGSDA